MSETTFPVLKSEPVHNSPSSLQSRASQTETETVPELETNCTQPNDHTVTVLPNQTAAEINEQLVGKVLDENEQALLQQQRTSDSVAETAAPGTERKRSAGDNASVFESSSKNISTVLTDKLMPCSSIDKEQKSDAISEQLLDTIITSQQSQPPPPEAEAITSMNRLINYSSENTQEKNRSTLKMLKFKNNKLEPVNNESGEAINELRPNQERSLANFRKNHKKLKKLNNNYTGKGQFTQYLQQQPQQQQHDQQAQQQHQHHMTAQALKQNDDYNQLPPMNGGSMMNTTETSSPMPVGIDSKLRKGGKTIFAIPQDSGKPAIPCEVFQQFGDSGFEVFWRSLIYFHSSKKVEKKSEKDVKGSAQEEFTAQQSYNRHKSRGGRHSKHEKEAGLLYLTRPTLNNITGSFRSGQMTAIMGPSGAGKTVFLNVITARLSISARKENSGDILINGTKQVRIGFVEQFDRLLPHLTVRETLLLSSRIKNAARYYLNHDKIVDNVIARLDLYDCEDIYVSQCSNGQRKRVSIGIELCFSSDILILDEPTTGLDAVTSFGIMEILKNLTRRRRAIAILATIHQPSVQLFNLFDNLLVLSKEGTIIYEGSPDKLASTLSLVGLRAPLYSNISDFLLEVVSGDFGRQSLHLLAHYNKEYNRSRISEDLNEVEMNSLQEAVKRGDTVNKRSFLLCTWLLFVRTMLCNFRNSFNSRIRFISMIISGVFLGLLFTNETGKVSTCPPNKYFLWTLEMSNMLAEIENQQKKVQENIASIFMVTLVSLFNSLLNLVVTFPIEVAVFRREYNNYSYMMISYFLAKLLGDIPFTTTSTVLFGAIVHQMTGQIFDNWTRPLLLVLPLCASTLIGQFLGMTIGVIFADNITASVYSVMFIIIPIIMFAGFFRLLVDMRWFMRRLSWLSPLKHVINSIMIVTYGLDRCEHEDMFEKEAFIRRNITEEEARPQWINSLTTLVSYQLQMSSEQNEELLEMFKNSSIEPEKKLFSFMGLNSDTANGEATKASILKHFSLGSTLQDYWSEIESLGIYILIYAVILYTCMFIRFSPRK